MTDTKSRIVLLVYVLAAASAAISLSASSYENDQRSYSLEGAWLCSVQWKPGGPIFPFLETHTASATNPFNSGTILCSLSLPDFDLYPRDPGNPLMNLTEAGHGNWIRISKNEFAFTVNRILIYADGKPYDPSTLKPVGYVKFWGTRTVTSDGEYSGTLNADYRDGAGNLLLALRKGITTGHRIPVDVEQQ